MRLTPKSAILIVAGFTLLFLVGQSAVDAYLGRARLELVRPGQDGAVRIDVSDLERLDVRFFRFLNSGNQEVEFLVGRDENGIVQVGFNANDNHYKTRLGFSYQDGWIIDNKCDTNIRLSGINRGGGGCKPVPVRHQVVGDELIIREPDMLAGWRYFR